MSDYYKKYLSHEYSGQPNREKPSVYLDSRCQNCAYCYAADTDRQERRQYVFIKNDDFGNFMNFKCTNYNKTVYVTLFEEPKGSPNFTYEQQNGKLVRVWAAELLQQRMSHYHRLIYPDYEY